MVYFLQDRGYELFSYATEKGKVSSGLLQGLEVDLQEVFQEFLR
ncbi:MAG: hypothetical protein N3C13_03850 [Aquificaceae bacterium]|nr:hypothetical protein [Aquificaceae bacterium]MCX8060315.1 hypothetical protein [Aquificaceae bacterium]MDW8097052.1 hypothetical protein [Aquificaceae bacterium]